MRAQMMAMTTPTTMTSVMASPSMPNSAQCRNANRMASTMPVAISTPYQ